MSFSVDLDPLEAYCQIHAISKIPEALRQIIIERAVPRYRKLLDQLGIKATFFVVGSDLDMTTNSMLAELVDNGHELANHTYNHCYDLLHLSVQELEREIRLTHDSLSELCGRPPCGFRTPGYGLNSAALKVLESLNYKYDSSILPSPPYYLIKSVVMAAMTITGRHSGAVKQDPRMLLAPLYPYRPELHRPWKFGKANTVELPLTVASMLRLPLIGTILVVMPEVFRRIMIRLVSRREFVNFECHGIDLIDAAKDRIPDDLVARQPDLRVGLGKKLDALRGSLEELCKTHKPVTLAQAADYFQQKLNTDNKT